SKGVAKDLSRLSGIALNSIEVIYNPVAVSSVDYEAAGAEAAWVGARRGSRILTVGSLKTQKHHALLIRAFARIATSVDATLMLLGEGTLRHSLQELAYSEGVADRVLMPGFVSDPGPYYRSADLFVLSSDYEGFGNVV